MCVILDYFIYSESFLLCQLDMHVRISCFIIYYLTPHVPRKHIISYLCYLGMPLYHLLSKFCKHDCHCEPCLCLIVLGCLDICYIVRSFKIKHMLDDISKLTIDVL